ncbi:MAG: B12-binding domain-containing protein [Anaerolineales bacterium]
MPISQTPAYNLKAVLKETGIAADTLRAWERRYGLPMPERTSGGHRLYSLSDIETVKWLMARQAEGLSISHAVEMWKDQIASGADPLAASGQQTLLSSSNMNLVNVRRDWLEACFRYDTVAAEQILNQAFAAHSIEIACTEVMMQGLFEVGEQWHKGIASVQQEHFASAIAMRRLESLISAAPPPTHPEVIITACPPEEWHTFPLSLITLFLRRRGWNVVTLGANVPTNRMEDAIDAIHPRLVILAAQTLMTAVSLRKMARLLNQKEVQTAFGGRVFNLISGLSRRIPAHFLGNTIESSTTTIEGLIANPMPMPAERVIDDKILQTASAYEQERLLIETSVLETIKSPDPMIEYIDTANQFLGKILTAALELGDISLLSEDLYWLTNLLNEHQVSVSLLPIFLDAYAQATRKVMGERGNPISFWLALEAQKLIASG